jgi:HEAT repeat protein
MSMTMSELRAQLSSIEPTEATYAGIGPEEVDLLRVLLDDDEAWMAARAVHALARIDDPAAREALAEAAGKPRMEVRVAVASAARDLPPDTSDEVLPALLADDHVAVRKFAVGAVTERNSAAVRDQVASLADSEPDDRVRGLAGEKARSVS